tara:strand:+ start:45251 stop:47701 length:2451 start_codon:yes stop_codon:yes gene_type:complete
MSTESSGSFAYRADIDGLRALAVLGVIVYHLGVSSLHGGFVGVDVFFVISGYLITQRLYRGFLTRREGGTYSLREFFLRRIRRLFPAMLTTTILTLALGCIFLSPSALMDLARSAIATVFSVANIYFYQTADYWARASETMPLLHMWSLAVEEQFYLVWPFALFLIVFWHPPRWLLAGIFLLIILASLVLTHFWTAMDQSAAFYLTPLRIYEFMIGGICVLADRWRYPQTRLAVIGRSAAFLLGLALVIWSMFSLYERGAFPGVIAIVPSVGAALLILARQPPILGLILANGVAGYIGRISYSLYLLHWPLIVYFNTAISNPLAYQFVLLVLAIMVAAIVQYTFVETPLRSPVGSRKTSFAAPGAFRRNMIYYGSAITGVVVICAGILALQGVPGRFAAARDDIVIPEDREFRAQRFGAISGVCQLNREMQVCGEFSGSRPNVLVIGDSFAVHGYIVAHAALPEANLLVSSVSGCPFFSEAGNRRSECEAANIERRTFIAEHGSEISGVLLADRFTADRADVLAATLSWLAERVPLTALLGVSPTFSQSLPELLTTVGLRASEYEQRQTWPAMDALTDRLAVQGIEVWDPRVYFCASGPCDLIDPESRMPVLTDEHHLSLPAAQAFGAWLRGSGQMQAFAALISPDFVPFSPPELASLTSPLIFDGNLAATGRISAAGQGAPTGRLSVVLRSGQEVGPELGNSDTTPPMPMIAGSFAIYQKATGYALRLQTGVEVQLAVDDVTQPVRLDLIIADDEVEVYVDGVLLSRTVVQVDLRGRYRLGSGYLQRNWIGEISGIELVLNGASVPLDLTPSATQ